MPCLRSCFLSLCGSSLSPLWWIALPVLSGAGFFYSVAVVVTVGGSAFMQNV